MANPIDQALSGGANPIDVSLGRTSAASSSSNPIDSALSGGAGSRPFTGQPPAAVQHLYQDPNQPWYKRAWDWGNTPITESLFGMPEERQGAGGFERAVEHIASGLTSPLSLALTAATFGTGGAVESVGASALREAGLGAEQIANAVKGAEVASTAAKSLPSVEPVIQKALEEGGHDLGLLQRAKEATGPVDMSEKFGSDMFQKSVTNAEGETQPGLLEKAGFNPEERDALGKASETINQAKAGFTPVDDALKEAGVDVDKWKQAQDTLYKHGLSEKDLLGGNMLERGAYKILRTVAPDISVAATARAAKTANTILNAGFTYQQLESAAAMSPRFLDALKEGDYDHAMEYGTEALVGGGLGIAGASHALSAWGDLTEPLFSTRLAPGDVALAVKRDMGEREALHDVANTQAAGLYKETNRLLGHEPANPITGDKPEVQQQKALSNFSVFHQVVAGGDKDKAASWYNALSEAAGKEGRLPVENPENGQLPPDLDRLIESNNFKDARPEYQNMVLDSLKRVAEGKLSDKELAAAKYVSDQQSRNFEIGANNGLLTHQIQDYMRRVYKDENPDGKVVLSHAKSGNFATRVSMARQRVYDSHLTALLKSPKEIDFNVADNIAQGRSELIKAAANKQFMDRLLSKGRRWSDGRPLAVLSGRGNVTAGPNGEDPMTFISPDRVRKINISDEAIKAMNGETEADPVWLQHHPELHDYAREITKSGEVSKVYLVGSTLSKGKGNDVDLVYDFGNKTLPENQHEAAEAVTDMIENGSAPIDLDKYDSFFKVGDRYFHLQGGGGGREIVENTDYAQDQKGKPVVDLTERRPVNGQGGVVPGSQLERFLNDGTIQDLTPYIHPDNIHAAIARLEDQGERKEAQYDEVGNNKLRTDIMYLKSMLTNNDFSGLKDFNAQMKKVYAFDPHGYVTIDNAAMRGWNFVTNDPGGHRILVNTDIKVHPEFVDYLKNRLGLEKSGVGQSPVGKTLLRTGTKLKGLLLNLSPFHMVQEGLRAVMLGMSPFHAIGPDVESGARVNPADPASPTKIFKGVQNGLTTGTDYKAMQQSMEGVASEGDLIRKIPGVGKVVANSMNFYHDFLFKKYIPALKARGYELLFDRYQEAHPDWSVDRVAKVAAEHANDTFGGINWKAMGRSAATQDWMRIFTLAPDWMEAEMRSGARLFNKEEGGVSRMQVARMTMGMWGVARVLNLLTTGNPQLQAPFGLATKNKEGKEVDFSMRTLPTDLLHAATDPVGFMTGRLSPTVRAGEEVLSGRDLYGRKMAPQDLFADVFRNMAPIPLQAVGQAVSGTGPEVGNAGQLWKGVGGMAMSYQTPAQKMAAELAASHSEDGPVDPSQMARHRAIINLTDKVRAGEVPWSDVVKLVFNTGQIKESEMKHMQNVLKSTQGMDSTMASLYARAARLPAQQYFDVLAQANPAEKAALVKLTQQVSRKYMNKAMKDMTPLERAQDPLLQKILNMRAQPQHQ